MKTVQTAWVTGAEGALGGALVHILEEAGLSVKAITRTQVDLSNAAALRDFVKGAGVAPDALFHCAGGFRYAKTESCSDEDFEFLLNSNLRSSFHLIREIAPLMKKQGFGRMVFVGARAASERSGEGMGPYNASKAALHALITSTAAELQGSGVLISAVLPTILDTASNRMAMSGADFSKWVKLPDLCRLMRDLALRDAELFHGALIPVPGKL